MPRIILADDNDELRTMICSSLEASGYDVVEAGNGNECLRLVRAWHPDIVITDMNMPEKDGAEILLELRREFPGIPIIAISGGESSSQEDFLLVAKKLGAVCALAKPFLLAELRCAIKESLKQGRRDL